MTVISTWEAVPNRLEQFWLYLVEAAPDGVALDDLTHRFSPPSLPNASTDDSEAGGNIFSGVLQESQALGLVERRKGETDRIVPLLLPPDRAREEQKAQWFMEQLRRVLTTPEEAEARGQTDVPLALAWLALQSPLYPLIFSETKGLEIKNAFPMNENVLGLNNQASLAQCYYWARYLGFCTITAQQTRKDGRRSSTRIIVPDPTVAIRSLLPAIFAGERELTADEFLDRLGGQCPILERGAARKIVVSQAASPGDFPGKDEFSGGTSLAMLRLEAERAIVMDDLSDAKTPCLLNLGTNKRRFSHVRLAGGSHGVA